MNLPFDPGGGPIRFGFRFSLLGARIVSVLRLLRMLAPAVPIFPSPTCGIDDTVSVSTVIPCCDISFPDTVGRLLYLGCDCCNGLEAFDLVGVRSSLRYPDSLSDSCLELAAIEDAIEPVLPCLTVFTEPVVDSSSSSSSVVVAVLGR